MAWQAFGKVLGKLGFGPWGLAQMGANIGISLLLNKFLKPEPPPPERLESTIRGSVIPAQFVLGQRRVEANIVWASLEASDRRQLLLAGLISEDACESIEKVWVGGTEMPFDKNGNNITPQYGTQFHVEYLDPFTNLENVPPLLRQKFVRDARAAFDRFGTDYGGNYNLPSPFKARLWEYFKADGTEGEDIRNRVPQVEGREYNGQIGGQNRWGPTPTAQTTLFRDPCVEDQEMEFEDQFGFHGDDPFNRQCPQPYLPPVDFKLERKPWTEDHKLNGISWVGIELMQPFYDSQDLSSRFYKNIPKIEVLVRGIKPTFKRWTYDAMGNRSLETVTEWTDNPIALMYWYDTVRRGYPEDAFDDEAIADAYEKCEELVSYTDEQIPDSHAYLRGNNTTKRYSCNVVIESGMEPAQVEAMILATCAGFRFEVDGKIIYRVGEDRTPVAVLAETDFVQNQSVKPWPALDDRVNKINAILEQAEETNYKRDSLSFTDTQREIRDGETRAIEVNLAGVQNHLQAGRVIANLLRAGRESLTFDSVIAPQIFMQHFEWLPGDILTFPIPEYGILSKNWEIQSVRKNFDGTLSATFKEDLSGTYADTLVLPELQSRNIEFGETGEGTPVPDIKAIETPVVEEGRCIVHDVETYPPANTFGKNGDRAYDRNGIFGIKTNDEWQRFAGRWWQEGQTGFVTRYKTVADLPAQPQLTEVQRQAIRRGGAFVSVIDNTHQVFSYSLDRGRQIQIMNICEQTASPGLIPGIPCNLCYRIIEDWGDGSKFNLPAVSLESGVLWKATDLTVFQIGDGNSGTGGDITNPTPPVGNGYWLYSNLITTQAAPTDEILGTNTRIDRLGYDLRGGDIGGGYRARARMWVDVEQIDPMGASKDWTEEQRDNIGVLLIDQEGGWRFWWNRDYFDVDPFRGRNETGSRPNTEQGALLDFFKNARDNSHLVNVYFIDMRKIFIGQALRMDWGPPSFGNYSGFETTLENRRNTLGIDDRGITYTSDGLTDWSFADSIDFAIRTLSSTGRSLTATISPLRRDIRKENLLVNPQAIVPSNIDSTSIALFTVAPANAVSNEFAYNQDIVTGDPEDAASGNGTSTPAARINVSGLNPNRFTRIHARYLGASQATGTLQSQWFGCLYRTLEDKNRIDVPQVTGIYFDPVTATSAVARWAAIDIPRTETAVYEWNLTLSGSNTPLFQGTTENLSVALSGLSPDSIYILNIRARVRAYLGEFSSSTLVTTPALTIPRNLNVKRLSTSAVRIVCDPVDCIDAFIWDLEDQFGNVIRTLRTTEPFVDFDRLNEAARYRATVAIEISGQRSYRTSLQFTTCLTANYRGVPLTYTLAETATTATVDSNGIRPGDITNIYLARQNVPTEPDFAGGKIASVDFIRRFELLPGRTVFTYTIEFNAKDDNLFTQVGFNTDADGKRMYITYDGFNYTIPGTFTFTAAKITMTPLVTVLTYEDGNWIKDLESVVTGDNIIISVAEPQLTTPGSVPDSVNDVVFANGMLLWEPKAGATGYDVTVFRGERLVHQRSAITNVAMEDLSMLTGGYNYFANVTAITDGVLHLPRSIEIEVPGTVTGGVVGSTDDMVAVENILATVDKDRIVVIFDPATTGGEHSKWGYSFRGINGITEKPRIEIFEETAFFSDNIMIWPVRGMNDNETGPRRGRAIVKSAGSLGPIIPGCIQLRVSNISNIRACVQWNIPFGTTKYVFRTNAGVTTTGFGVIYTNGTELTGLTASTNYFYGNRPVSSEGREGIEGVINFSTESEAICGTPTTDPCSESACVGTSTIPDPGGFFVVPTCGTATTPPCAILCPPNQRRNTPDGPCELIPCPPNQERRTPNSPCIPINICMNCPPCQSCKTGETVCTDDPCPQGTERKIAGQCCTPIELPCEAPCFRAAGGRCCCPGENCNVITCGQGTLPPCDCPPCMTRIVERGQGICRPAEINCPSGQTRASGGACCIPDCPPNQSRENVSSKCCPNDPCPAVQCPDGSPAYVSRNNNCGCESTCADLVKTCPDGTTVGINEPCPAPCFGLPDCPQGQIRNQNCNCIALPIPPTPPIPQACINLPPCPEGQQRDEACICTNVGVCSCPDLDGNPQIEGTIACSANDCGQYCNCWGTVTYAEIGSDCPECPTCNPSLPPCPEGQIRHTEHCRCETVESVLITDPCRDLPDCPEGQSYDADCMCVPDITEKTCPNGDTVPVTDNCPCFPECMSDQICNQLTGLCIPINITKVCPNGDIVPQTARCPCPPCQDYNISANECQAENCTPEQNRCQNTRCCHPACPPPETRPSTEPGVTGQVTVTYTWNSGTCQCEGTAADIVTVNCACPEDADKVDASIPLCPPTDCPCPTNQERKALANGRTADNCTPKDCPPDQSRRTQDGECMDDPCPSPENCYERVASGQPCVLKKDSTCACPPFQERDALGVCIDADCPIGTRRNAPGCGCYPPCPVLPCPVGQARDCFCECRPAGCTGNQVLTEAGCEECPACPDGTRIRVRNVGSSILTLANVCSCEPDDEETPCPRCQQRTGDSPLCVNIGCPSGYSFDGTGSEILDGCCKEIQKSCADFPPVPQNDDCPCPRGQRRPNKGDPCSACAPCPQGQICNQQTGNCECAPCPRGSSRPTGATNCNCTENPPTETDPDCQVGERYSPVLEMCVPDNPADPPCPDGEIRVGTGNNCHPINCSYGRNPNGTCRSAPPPPPACPSNQTRNSQGFCCPDSCPSGCSAQTVGGSCDCRDNPCPSDQTRGGDCGPCEETGCGIGQIRCSPGSSCTPTPAPCPNGQSRTLTCGPCTNDPCPANQSRPSTGGPCEPDDTTPTCPSNERFALGTCICNDGYVRNSQGVCERITLTCPPCEEVDESASNRGRLSCQPIRCPACQGCNVLTGQCETVQCPSGQKCSATGFSGVIGGNWECIPEDENPCGPCEIRTGTFRETCTPVVCSPNQTCNPSTNSCECDSVSCPPCEMQSATTCSCVTMNCPRGQSCNPTSGNCETPECGECQRYNSTLGRCIPLVCSTCRECVSGRCEPMICPEGQVCRNNQCVCPPCSQGCQSPNAAGGGNCCENECQFFEVCDDNVCKNRADVEEPPEGCDPGEFFDPGFGCRPDSAPPAPVCPRGQSYDANLGICLPSGPGTRQKVCPDGSRIPAEDPCPGGGGPGEDVNVCFPACPPNQSCRRGGCVPN